MARTLFDKIWDSRLDDIGLTLKQRAAIEAWEARAARLHPFLQAGIVARRP